MVSSSVVTRVLAQKRKRKATAVDDKPNKQKTGNMDLLFDT